MSDNERKNLELWISANFGPYADAASSALAEIDRLRSLNAELVGCLEDLTCLISVNGPDVGIISDPHTIKTIHRSEAALREANKP